MQKVIVRTYNVAIRTEKKIDNLLQEQGIQAGTSDRATDDGKRKLLAVEMALRGEKDPPAQITQCTALLANVRYFYHFMIFTGTLPGTLRVKSMQVT